MTPSNAATNATATTEITRQDLVETDSADGTLGYSDSREVVNRLSGTVTWLPPTGDDRAAERRALPRRRVAGDPSDRQGPGLPRARAAACPTAPTSSSSSSSLRALGYDPSGAITVDDDWDSGTTAAVERWQDAHGFSRDRLDRAWPQSSSSRARGGSRGRHHARQRRASSAGSGRKRRQRRPTTALLRRRSSPPTARPPLSRPRPRPRRR